MAKIETLTPEQEKLLQDTYNDALRIGRDTGPIDWERTTAAITAIYGMMNQSAPIFVRCQSPVDIVRKWKELTTDDKKAVNIPGTKNYNPNKPDLWDRCGVAPYDVISDCLAGNQGPSIYVWAKYLMDIGADCPDDLRKQHAAWYAQWRYGGWWVPFDTHCFISERPKVLTVDAEGRLHNEDGPAVMYADGFGVWAWHGIVTTKQVIEEPHTLDWTKIRDEQNAELRRVMMTKFGEARYVQASGAKLQHEDEFGQLYRSPVPGDEDLVVVRVINSSPEPMSFEAHDGYVLKVDHTNNLGQGYIGWDVLGTGLGTPLPHGVGKLPDGTTAPIRVFKVYWLRVPPETRTAHEGVASTWRWPDGSLVFENHKDYRPDIET